MSGMNGINGAFRRPVFMGMNRRNRHLVDALNPKKWIAVANHKVATKRYLEEHDIPTPETLAVIRYSGEIAPAYEKLIQYGRGFVVKPAQSARGRGVALYGRAAETEVVMHSEATLPKQKFLFSLLKILHGEYSGGKCHDVVLIEQRIEPDCSWILSDLPAPPDLRIIVQNGRPIMAMARVPTEFSQGRANLHCGAVGVGVDLETAETTHAIWRDRVIDRHPDTGETLAGKFVKGLDECLSIAKRCYETIPLGYMGVDLLLDAREGPMVIEVNARPGLSVQLANQKSLLEEILELEQVVI